MLAARALSKETLSLDIDGAAAKAAVYRSYKAEAVAGKPVQLPPAISLGWYRGFDGESLVAEPPMPVRAGDRWRWTVRRWRCCGASPV